MNIYTVYFYFNMYADSYERDRLYFVDIDKAREYEKKLIEENKFLIDSEHDVYFEKIEVIV